MRHNKTLISLGAAVAMAVLTLLMAPGAWAQAKYKTLHGFTKEQGSFVHWTLTFDAAGNLYGTSCYGGTSGDGIVFKLAPDPEGGWTETTLHDFTGGADGSCPQGALIFDLAGNLYASAYQGGAYGAGNVFELTPNPDGSWTESVLYNFTGDADGDGPNPIIFDAQGALYGTTTWSTTAGWGGVFKLTQNPDGTWSESDLYSFTGGNDGGHPVVGLVFDAAGNLYGMTQWSGAYGNGVVFGLAPNPDGSWKESVLHTFTGGKDGGGGGEGLIFDTAGNLYGVTWGGGRYGNGVVFRLTPNPGGSWKESVVHAFTGGKDGAVAGESELTFDSAGNLYGTANAGGNYGYGVVYRLTPNSTGGGSYQVLHAFKDGPGDPGAYPAGGVIFDVLGNLYGTTGGDGSKTFGSVYEIVP
ncbi:MAG: choice-of-anchor tandem repeat GloVer-containing protein [Candidatus Sulfotelmatobacter sp.]